MKENSDSKFVARDGIPDNASASPGPNLLRDKAFNDELKEILHRIEYHEKSRGESPRKTPSRKIKDLTQDDLILLFHRLYYRVQFVDEYSTLHTSFNPFAVKSVDKPLDAESFKDEFLRVVKSIGVDSYAVMRYSMQSRCFSTAEGGISSLPQDDFIIGLQDPLFRSIMNAPRGIVIGKDELTADPFMSRISDWNILDNGDRFFFIDFSAATRKAREEIFAESYDIDPLVPPPILVLHFNTARLKKDTEALQATVAEMLSAMIMLLEPVNTAMRNRPDDLAGILEDYAVLSFRNDSRCCVQIAWNSNDIQGLFIVRYFIEKMKRLLDSESGILQVNQRSAVVFIEGKKLSTVMEILNSWNSLCDGALTIKVLRNSEFTHPNEMVKTILFSL